MQMFQTSPCAILDNASQFCQQRNVKSSRLLARLAASVSLKSIDTLRAL
jgi:hypothetical protein